MIIVNARAGQRSNRLFTIAHAMGTALERGEQLRLTAFGKYASDYEGCRPGFDGLKIRVLIQDSPSWEVVRLVIAAIKRIWKGFRVNAAGVLTIVSDFTYQDLENFKKHADEIRIFFTPRGLDGSYDKNKDNVIVGVHVRRGDYREWQGGRYYYDDQIYSRIAERVDAVLRDSAKRVKFVLFSNEDVQGLFNMICQLFASRGASSLVEVSRGKSDVEDQWLMSKCDYLIGPPSTFTMWASFMGKVPCLHVESADQPIRLEDFSCVWS